MNSPSTLDVNGMAWSPKAAELALEILRREGRVDIVGVPPVSSQGFATSCNFDTEHSLKQWSDHRLLAEQHQRLATKSKG